MLTRITQDQYEGTRYTPAWEGASWAKILFIYIPVKVRGLDSTDMLAVGCSQAAG